MPFIQGDDSSLPNKYKSYSDIINNNYIEKGEIGFLTIDESFVEKGISQRGFNSMGINRNVHIEVGRNNDINSWGGSGTSSWGGKNTTKLEDSTIILIANSISNTCKYWNKKEYRYTKNGDLSKYINSYNENTGILMKAGELAKLSIFNPHECLPQVKSAKRQFFRIVGKGVTGRENYFTINPLVTYN